MSELFVNRGNGLFEATPAASGPWHPNTQHGSAIMGLLAHVIENFPCDFTCQTTRLTVDILRPVPLGEVQTVVKEVSSSKNLSILEVELFSQQKLYAKALANRLSIRPIEPSDHWSLRDRYAIPQKRPQPIPGANPDKDMFGNQLEIIPDLAIKDGAVWYKFSNAILEGEPLSGLQKAAVLSDWTYATPRIVTQKRLILNGEQGEISFGSINIDNSINLSRYPIGDWVGIRAEQNLGETGAGFASGFLFDEEGYFGCSHQTLMVRE